MSVVTLTKYNYKEEVLDSKGKVLVDFWASWCGPCRMLGPVVDEVAVEVQGKYKIGKVNIDEQPELAEEFKVMSIPTLVLIEDGKVIDSTLGVVPKTKVLELLGADTL